MNSSEEKHLIEVTSAFGIKTKVPAEWLDDCRAEWFLETLDEIMLQPLHPTSRYAFCAPEVIRGKIASDILLSHAP